MAIDLKSWQSKYRAKALNCEMRWNKKKFPDMYSEAYRNNSGTLYILVVQFRIR